MATEKRVNNLSINTFTDITVYESHKNEQEVRNGLNLVPLEGLGEWKQAFTGNHTSTSTPICTLPQEAKECVVVFTGTENNNDVEFHANILLAPDRKSRDTYYHFASIIPRTRHNDYMWLRVLISSRRQVSLYNTSVSGLMFVSRVYWR